MMTERLTLVPRVRQKSISGPAKSYTALQRFTSTAFTSTQVPVLPWRYVAAIGTANSLHTSAKYGGL